MKKKPDSAIIGDPVALIEQLADQSAQAGYYGLQDANLILVEAVRELQSNKKASKILPALVTTWVDLFDQFKANPKQAVSEIVTYLRRPDLKIPMEDDEFAMLADQISNDAIVAAEATGLAEPITAANTPERLSEEHIATVEQFADKAAAEGLYGLQDVNLLLAESLRELANSGEAVDPSLTAALSGWPGLLSNYRTEPQSGSIAIINFLRHPGLNIPMGDDEFAMLQEQLTSEAAVDTAVQEAAPVVAASPSVQETKPSGKEPTAAVSRVAQELVDLLMMESEQIRSHLQGIAIGNNESALHGLQEAGDELERLANMSKTAGFEGLALVSNHILTNIQRFIEQIDGFTSERLDLLLEWLDQVQEYLPSFNDSDAGQLIVTGLIDEQWAVPLPFEEMAAILLQIRTESSGVGSQTEAARKDNGNR